MENKEFSFEEAVRELENIVAALERGDVSLEDSLKLYEKGVGLVREANKLLSDAKERIIAVSGVQTND